MTDVKQTAAETLLAKLHDCLWASRCMQEEMDGDQVDLMYVVHEFIRARNLDSEAAPPDPQEGYREMSGSRLQPWGDLPSLTTDERVLEHAMEFYALSPVPERPFVTIVHNESGMPGEITILFPPGVPDEFKVLARERLESFVHEKINKATLAAMKATVLHFWRDEISARRMTYLPWLKEWRMTPA